MPVKIIGLEEVMKLKGGENSHLKAELFTAVDTDGKPIGRDLYSKKMDLGAKAREPGWTNIGDISACLRTSVALGEIYKSSDTPHIAVASKHTRPVAIAKGRTQLEAIQKANAGDLNSPSGGVWGLNTRLEYDAAQFFDKMFIEAIVAPEYCEGTAELLQDSSKISTHKNRFLIKTGYLLPEDVDVFQRSITPVACGKYLLQDREKPYIALQEAVMITGNQGNPDIKSMDKSIIDDIEFAGNVALYLSSNLVFFVHDGAIAGLGDGCGARVVAARKARNALEDSAYAAIAIGTDEEWDRVLYDTPFTREDFAGIRRPIRLTAFSDAFIPKMDGFVETSGIDRIKEEFGKRKYEYVEDGEEKVFIPKRKNFDPNYNRALIPAVIVQPGGSLGDKLVVPLAEEYGIKMAFTMTPELGAKYLAGEKVNGRTPTGRRFFGHNIMH